MTDSVRVPVRMHNNERWGALSFLEGGKTIEVIAERFEPKNDSFSFIGGHRVRLYKLKSSVHFKVPTGVTLDISGVPPATQPTLRKKGR
jgi:hypothetical protein